MRHVPTAHRRILLLTTGFYRAGPDPTNCCIILYGCIAPCITLQVSCAFADGRARLRSLLVSLPFRVVRFIHPFGTGGLIVHRVLAMNEPAPTNGRAIIKGESSSSSLASTTDPASRATATGASNAAGLACSPSQAFVRIGILLVLRAFVL